MQYLKKPVVIEAITFAELVAYGLANGANVVNGMPWSFSYQGHPITHENDECYLIPTLEGTMQLTPDDVLITGVKGEIYPCKKDIFDATYAPLKVLEPTENRRYHSQDGLFFERLPNGYVRITKTIEAKDGSPISFEQTLDDGTWCSAVLTMTVHNERGGDWGVWMAHHAGRLDALEGPYEPIGTIDPANAAA